jgi:predicted nucleic acid-binding protein
VSIKIGLRVAQKAAYLIKQYPNVFGKDISRGTADALIAASAWQLKAPLYTLNTRHFANFDLAEISTVVIDQESRSWIPYAP